MREPGDRTMIRLPEECKEYLAIYTTEYDDSYVLETIVADDIVSLRQTVSGQKERIMEAEFKCREEPYAWIGHVRICGGYT